MKTIKNWMLVALVTGLGACSNEENVLQDVKNPITVEAGFGLSGRVTTDGLTSIFEAKDAIGVYAWTGGTTMPDASNAFQVYNVTNTYDGTNWSATPQMLWMDDATPHYFLGVYPQTDILTTTTYTLDPTDQVKSDLLVALNYGAENKGIAQQSNPVPLAFGHVMAKLRVNIKFNDEFTTQPAIEGVTAEAKKTATIDWGTATATATGEPGGVDLQACASASGYAYSYESVMVPQTGFKSVAMVVGGQTYTFNSTKDIELKKGRLTTFNLTVGKSSLEMDDITINPWVSEGTVDGFLTNIDEQIAAINASLGDLKGMDTELGGYIESLQTTVAGLQTQIDATDTALEALKTDLEGQITASEQKVLNELDTLKTALDGQLATINTTIEALQTKDTELDKKIADLQKYVDDELTATEDWATATFSTLEQYEATQTAISEINALIGTTQESITTLEEKLNKKIADDIAAAVAGVNDDIAAKVTEITDAYTAAVQTAKDDITAAYTEAIKTAIADSEASMKEWVNETLADGYYNMAAIDAKLEDLKASVTTYDDTELKAAIEAQQAALEQAKKDLTAAYEAAIKKAIEDNNGVIDDAIAAAITAATNNLQSKIDGINSEIDSIKNRLENLEQNFANRIQSLVFVPQYSDGKILMDYTGRTTQAHFRISPAAIAKLIAVENVTAFARYINDPTARAYEPEFPLVVESVTGDESGMLEVNLKEDSENLFDTDFWVGKKEAVIYIRISDGNSDVVSNIVPMMAHGYGSNEGNQVYGFGDGNTYTGEITE